MGENEYGKSGHLSIFTLLKHLMMLLKYNFSGLNFYTLSKTLIACGAMHLRFFEVETLLNNAFKVRGKWHDAFKRDDLLMYIYIAPDAWKWGREIDLANSIWNTNIQFLTLTTSSMTLVNKRYLEFMGIPLYHCNSIWRMDEFNTEISSWGGIVVKQIPQAKNRPVVPATSHGEQSFSKYLTWIPQKYTENLFLQVN